MSYTLSQLVTAFIMAGGIGFVNFYILSKMDKISINRNEKEDKTLIILFFTVINYATYLAVKGITAEKLSGLPNPLIESISIGSTLLITIICSFTIFPILLTFAGKLIDKTRTSVLKKSSKHNFSPKSKAFDVSSAQEVFIFTLEYVDGRRNYITNGFMDNWSDLEEYENQFTITPSPSPFEGINNDYTEDEVIKLMNIAQDNGSETLIYVDIKQRLIYYIIYYDVQNTKSTISEVVSEQ